MINFAAFYFRAPSSGYFRLRYLNFTLPIGINSNILYEVTYVTR